MGLRTALRSNTKYECSSICNVSQHFTTELPNDGKQLDNLLACVYSHAINTSNFKYPF